jgi:hypothetical protein
MVDVHEHEMGDQAVRRGQLAAQLPFLLAHALAHEACRIGCNESLVCTHEASSLVSAEPTG